MKPRVHAVILAAGASSRFGEIKQLTKFNGSPLLKTIQNQMQQLCQKTYVVLGARHSAICQSIAIKRPIINQHWQSGMSSSISVGVVEAKSGADGILFCLSDQPHIDIGHYQQLLSVFNQQPDKIVASTYEKTQGVPVIFPAVFLTY